MRRQRPRRLRRRPSISPPVYPVILCGGSGERLWPASRPWRPKPFLTLTGARSGFQTAVLRAQPLASGGILVVGGEAHADLIAAQLAEIGVEAQVFLEPASRDTAPAIAAAAAWVDLRGTDAIVAVMPADHHIPDAAAFEAAVRASLAAAERAIVTLGVRPTGPASAYGYIRPGAAEGPVKPITTFVEKPTAEAAAGLIAQGALWNSGTFIGSAQVFVAEFRRWAGPVYDAAWAALLEMDDLGGDHLLGPSFGEAPKVAFDRAVMEKTDRGGVLPVDFAWSDLGAWDAVLAADPDGAIGPGAVVSDGERVLARAAAGMRVAVVGLSDVAVVAEPDAVLVTALSHSQAVRDQAAQFGVPVRYGDVGAAAAAFDTWLRTAALPLWATVGVDEATGGFREALTWDGAPADPRRRARVQARQAFVFASAAAAGLPGPWLAIARAGMGFYLSHARRPDGLYASTLDLAGRQADPTPRLYEHAFVLLALAALQRADPGDPAWGDEASALGERLVDFRHPGGGFREAGDDAFQANAHMHLFEAALAWEAASGAAAWAKLADEIAELALSRFINPADGALREFYDADWRPLAGWAGLIEPGHQFEWAWLLERWGEARVHAAARAAAKRLFAVGRRGFDPARGVVANALHDDLTIRDPAARLWPQTEHLKAALALGETGCALEAANGLAVYLDTPARGVWRERMRPDGGFLDEPAPATSLYHLYLAIRELARAAGDPC